MLDELAALRSALEQEMQLSGRFVPLDEVAAPSQPDIEPVQLPTESTPSPRMETPYDRINALIPAGSPLLGMNTLEELQQYVATTQLIDLDKTRLNPVFGVGNPDANLMVIGEAPGEDEDKQGEPFVGRAGQLLDKILAAVGFQRSEVYIANILKSRPPNNRTPRPDEVAAHIPILYRQIVLIKPCIILCVGKTSGNGLLANQASLGQMRGHLENFHGLPVVVTYHPAALLRNPEWKRPTWEDVQMMRAEYDRLTQ